MERSQLFAELTALDLLNDVSPDQIAILCQQGECVELTPGEILMRQGEYGDAMFLVLHGTLDVCIAPENKDKNIPPKMVIAEKGQPLGEMQLLTGGIRSATVRAREPVHLLRISKQVLARLEQEAPQVVTRLFQIVHERIQFHAFLEHIHLFFGKLGNDILEQLFKECEWIQLERGHILLHEGAPSDDGWYLVVNGRLGVYSTRDDGSTQLIDVVRQGESVGETALLTRQPRNATVAAWRDTTLLRFSPAGFTMLLHHDPNVLYPIVERVIQLVSPEKSLKKTQSVLVIAIGAITGQRLSTEFITSFVAYLEHISHIFFLNPQILQQILGISEQALEQPDHPTWARIHSWYEQIISRQQHVIIAYDPRYPAWNRFCQSNADIIVGIADGDQTPTHAQECRWFEPGNELVAQQRWLVLLHACQTTLPTGTYAWLERFSNPQHLHLAWPNEQELGRLLRMLTGNAIGLVLSGGSARATAHFGVLKAFEAVGIPVDRIGGTSMGALVAALYARRLTFDEILDVKDCFVRLKPFRAYGIPGMAFLRNRKIDAVAKAMFQELCIEDFWLPFFCVSTNLTTAQEIVHEQGKMWQATRATSSIPVILPPFIRDHHLLVDGGLLNNLPVDIMRQRTQGPIIASNASPEEDLVYHHERVINQSQSWREKLTFWRTFRKNPGILDILMRSMVISSVQKLASLKQEVDLFLQLPLPPVGITQFDAMEEMSQIVYDYAYPLLSEYKKKLVEDPRQPTIR